MRGSLHFWAALTPSFGKVPQMSHAITIRPACPDDYDRVSTLIARSYRALLADAYTPSVLRDALPLITRANPQLLRCGTYFLALDGANRPLAAGGWTDASPHGAPGRRGEGHVRHVATDPDIAMRGVGRRVMDHVLHSAASAGITLLHCQSTLNARGFYAKFGFQSRGQIDIRLTPGVLFPAVQMRRTAPACPI